MAILLIAWVCGSTLFCLALLGAAARPLPRRVEQVAAPAPQPVVLPARQVVPEDAKAVLPRPAVAVPELCHLA